MADTAAPNNDNTTPIIRFYIDVRPSIPKSRHQPVELPLLNHLPHDQQDKIKGFIRPADRLMSLASALLKYTFIHRHAQIPWNEVRISKTPDPHRRPYWEPGAGSTGPSGLEFNVSHQNGLIALIGCRTPTVQDPHYSSPITTSPSPSALQQPPVPETAHQQIRLGVDVACANEHGRTPADMTTQAKLNDWVDIFSEMFSSSCRNDMKYYHPPPPPTSTTLSSPSSTPSSSYTTLIHHRFRRFYAYWALKEAFIKMVGEGLLADWLTKLEFHNVRAPPPAPMSVRKGVNAGDRNNTTTHDDEETKKWTTPQAAVRDIGVSLYGKRLDTHNDAVGTGVGEGGVKMELRAYEDDFIIATAIKGVVEEENQQEDNKWVRLDFETDVRPCAEGRCRCLS